MKILARYLLGNVLRATAGALFALLALLSFFDVVHELQNVGHGSYTVVRLIVFIVLSAPVHVYELMPIASLLGGLWALSQLVASSEYTVMRTGGWSVASVIGNLTLTGLVCAGITLATGEFLAPQAERAAQQMRLAATGSFVAKDFRSGFWARDGDSFVNIGEVLPDATLRAVKIFRFDVQRRLSSITWAGSGYFDSGSKNWRLNNVTTLTFGSRDASMTAAGEIAWRSSMLSPDMLSALLVRPEQMSLQSLVSYIDHLKRNGQKTSRHEIALWSKIAYPLGCIAMLILALPFANSQRRSGGVGIKLFIGVMLGLAFFLLNQLCSYMGLLYDWPPILAAATPGAIAISAALGLLWLQERR
ncbi:LPS export ABC transporter permease LptG [Parachitinimonas caeni]|uniref:LPS export ABC transporter permease LptG n=1 Tax=Parachitinimonas caeni TaxID=3031301 RepID=A0ABT7DSP1_9NEIS|nr:LPS export ABC transporter permease LptG [Parachitinimonas caeni]MDK2123090.1 LPS export ABC transporter permease LptG [Parachitinimonas caeni]